MASELTRNGQVIGYRRDDLEINPPYLYPDYVSTRTRAPKRPLVPMPNTLSEVTGPVYGHERIGSAHHGHRARVLQPRLFRREVLST